MDHTDFEIWLGKYGDAWEGRDATSVTELFTPDALYYWTPFEAPKRGRGGIHEAWHDAVTGQKDIEFSSEILATIGNRGIARWWCSLVRLMDQRAVKLDGIFQVDFSENGLCEEFREWWHSDEELDG